MHKVYGLKRLWMLADYIEFAVKPERFAMHVWWDGEGRKGNLCGTQACAMGWATTIPAFKKAGLCLRYTSSNGGYPAVRHKVTADDSRWIWSHKPGEVVKDSDNGKVADRIFGISSDDYTYLFADTDAQCRQRSDQVYVMRAYVLAALKALPRKSKWKPRVGEFYGPG